MCPPRKSVRETLMVIFFSITLVVHFNVSSMVVSQYFKVLKCVYHLPRFWMWISFRGCPTYNLQCQSGESRGAKKQPVYSQKVALKPIPRNPGMEPDTQWKLWKILTNWWLKKFWTTLVENATAKRDDFSGETILAESLSNMGRWTRCWKS